MAKKARRVKRLDSIIKSTAYDPRRDGVTQGLLARWLRCRVDAKLYLQGWRPVGRKRSLRFGSFGHDVLQPLYKKAKKSQSTVRVRHAIIRRTIKTLVKDALANREPAQDVELDAALVEMLMKNYVIHYEGDFVSRRWVNVEKTFDVEYVPEKPKHSSYRLRGRRDGLFRLKKDGPLWLLETKTKSRIEEGVLEDSLSFDFQNLFYLHSAHIEFGEEVKGVLYNIVRVPTHKQGANESLRAYVKRVGADVEKRPDHFFKRYEITYSKRVRERFAKELDMKLFEFFQWCDGVTQTYRNEGACLGRWNCSFIPACASGRMVGFTQTGRLFEELED